jgi:hypothetical protein
MLGRFLIQYREFVIQGHQYENQDKFYQINPQMFPTDNIPMDFSRHIQKKSRQIRLFCVCPNEPWVLDFKIKLFRFQK